MGVAGQWGSTNARRGVLGEFEDAGMGVLILKATATATHLDKARLSPRAAGMEGKITTEHLLSSPRNEGVVYVQDGTL